MNISFDVNLPRTSRSGSGPRPRTFPRPVARHSPLTYFAGASSLITALARLSVSTASRPMLS